MPTPPITFRRKRRDDGHAEAIETAFPAEAVRVEGKEREEKGRDGEKHGHGPVVDGLATPFSQWRNPRNRLLIGTSWAGACGSCANQADLARDLGISQAQLSRYEKGKSEMGAEVLLRLARKCGKSMEWVLTGADR